MPGMTIFIVVVGLFFVVGGGLALWRLTALRSQGTSIIMRPLPAADGDAWRYGVMMYTDCGIKMYKLRSLRPGPNVVIARHDVEIVSRREPTDIEAGFFDPGLSVVEIQSTQLGKWELALTSSADTALVAWVESRPSLRQTRELPTNIERRFRAVRERRA